MKHHAEQYQFRDMNDQATEPGQATGCPEPQSGTLNSSGQRLAPKPISQPQPPTAIWTEERGAPPQEARATLPAKLSAAQVPVPLELSGEAVNDNGAGQPLAQASTSPPVSQDPPATAASQSPEGDPSIEAKQHLLEADISARARKHPHLGTNEQRAKLRHLLCEAWRNPEKFEANSRAIMDSCLYQLAEGNAALFREKYLTPNEKPDKLMAQQGGQRSDSSAGKENGPGSDTAPPEAAPSPRAEAPQPDHPPVLVAAVANAAQPPQPTGGQPKVKASHPAAVLVKEKNNSPTEANSKPTAPPPTLTRPFKQAADDKIALTSPPTAPKGSESPSKPKNTSCSFEQVLGDLDAAMADCRSKNPSITSEACARLRASYIEMRTEPIFEIALQKARFLLQSGQFLAADQSAASFAKKFFDWTEAETNLALSKGAPGKPVARAAGTASKVLGGTETSQPVPLEATASAISNQLSPEEQRALEECEAIIEGGRRSFLAVGQALARVRDQKLYRRSHATFEAYCRQRWQFTRAHGYRLIEAAATVQALAEDGEVKRMSPKGDITAALPCLEAHVRRLLQLAPEQQLKAWKAALQLAKGAEVTGKVLKRAMAQFRKPDVEQPKPAKAIALVKSAPLALVDQIGEAVRTEEKKQRILDLLADLKALLSHRARADDDKKAA